MSAWQASSSHHGPHPRGVSIKRGQRPEPAAPETNLGGRWDVNVEFFSSKSHHVLFLQQDGGRVNGSHKSDFSIRDVQGTIEGGQIKLRSNTAERGSGDSMEQSLRSYRLEQHGGPNVLESLQKAFAPFSEEEMLLLDGIVMEPVGDAE